MRIGFASFSSTREGHGNAVGCVPQENARTVIKASEQMLLLDPNGAVDGGPAMLHG
jgi:hypothetical protein